MSKQTFLAGAAMEAASDEDLFTADRFAWLDDETLATATDWDATKLNSGHLPHLTA